MTDSYEEYLNSPAHARHEKWAAELTALRKQTPKDEVAVRLERLQLAKLLGPTPDWAPESYIWMLSDKRLSDGGRGTYCGFPGKDSK